METPFVRRFAVILGLALAAGPLAAQATAAFPPGALAPRTLWEAWPAARVVPVSAACLRPDELVERLRALAGRHAELRLDEVGRSVEGRPIFRLELGGGPERLLLWSQMHGDEPSATPALLDLADYLLAQREDPAVARLLERFTLVMVPMLNPDGAEAYTRRNALGIDLNRDARNLTSPEARLLKRLRDELSPLLGFNLHDQNRRRRVGEDGTLAVGAVLAVVGDAAKTVTPGRLRAMRAGAAVAAALEPFAPASLARYDDSWSERSFGDNLTAWGTPVLLVESGGVPAGRPLSDLTRLNFVALGSVLAALAADDLAGFDAAAYAALPENSADVWADVALRGGKVRQPGSRAAYRADLAFNRMIGDREREGCVESKSARPPRSEIVELGDARVFGASREIDATGKVLLAPFVVGAEGFRARRFLDDAGLARLASLGVAEVRWSVPPRKLDAAERQARALRRPGRARLEVTTERRQLPPRVLRRAPSPPRSGSLVARLTTLEEASGVAALPGSEAERLAALWASARPTLRFEGPASFLVVAAPGEELLAGEVGAVFLEGVELAGEAR